MMAFCNVDNTWTVPTGLGKFPPGKSRGTLEGSYSAIRMSHEMTSLLSLDVLRGGGECFAAFLDPTSPPILFRLLTCCFMTIKLPLSLFLLYHLIWFAYDQDIMTVMIRVLHVLDSNTHYICINTQSTQPVKSKCSQTPLAAISSSEI